MILLRAHLWATGIAYVGGRVSLSIIVVSVALVNCIPV